jgi:hypothetical protein
MSHPRVPSYSLNPKDHKVTTTKSFTVKIPLGWISIILTAIFVTLKVTGQVGWEWWQVLMPLFVVGGIYVLLVVGAIVFVAIAATLFKNKSIGR